MKKVLLLLLVFQVLFSFSQEICDNAIDDDGDGLIDLNDTDCECVSTQEPVNYFPNPSFEDYIQCPDNWAQIDQSLEYWANACESSDYWNTACNWGGPTDYILPSDGDGMVGFIADDSFFGGYYEYFSTCLDTVLRTDTTYSVTFDAANVFTDAGEWLESGPSWYDGLSLEVAIYGNADCNNLAYDGGCPPAALGWELLGSAEYSVQTSGYSWVTLSFDFTPTFDVNAIMVGPKCPLGNNIQCNGNSPYFLIDNFIFVQDDIIEGSPIVETGSICDDNLVLTGEELAGASYQWYLNGVAIVGETGLSLNVSGIGLSDGLYSFVTTLNGACTRTNITIDPVVIPVSYAGEDQELCELTTFLTAVADTGTGTWAQISGPGTVTFTDINNPETEISASEHGTYVLRWTESFGGICSDFDEVNIVFNQTLQESDTLAFEICRGDSVQLDAGVGILFEWATDSFLSANNIPDPVAFPPHNISYTATITTIEGCLVNKIFNITVNPLPVGLASPENQSICSGESITDIQLSTTPDIPSDYTWSRNLLTEASGLPSSGTGNISGALTNNTSNQIDVQFDIVPQSLAGCVGDTFNTTVSIFPHPEITIDDNKIICIGDSIQLNVSGGDSYHWSPSNSLSNNTINNPIASPQASTMYYVTVTGGNNCASYDSIYVEVIDLTANITIENEPTCFGFCDGQASVSASEGDMPYDYVWSNSQSGSNVNSNLCTGSHSVIITDQNSCATEINFTLNEPELLEANSTNTNVECYGEETGELVINATGGTAPYNYNIGTGTQTEHVFQNLGTGNYEITVTDNNNCTVTIYDTITSPTAISATGYSYDNVSCYAFADGEISIGVEGGIPPYNYSKNDGENNNDGNFTDLEPGNYIITVTDANNCNFVCQPIDITQPDNLIIEDQIIENAACADDYFSIEVSMEGGTPSYEYSIDNQNWQTSAVFNSLEEGTYNIYIRDNNNCLLVSNHINLVAPEPLIVDSVSINDVSCYGFNDGSFTVFASGGTPPLIYSNGLIPQSENVFDELGAGSYSVSVTDANQCQATYTPIIITEPNPITVSITKTDVSCYDFCDGSLLANAEGGVGMYSYYWSNNNQGSEQFDICSGNYSVTAVDANICTAVSSVELINPGELQLFVPNNVQVCYGEDVILNLETLNGVNPVEFYQGSQQVTSPFIDHADSSKTYSFFAIDANGCISDQELTNVSVIPPIELSISIDNDSVCPGEPVIVSGTATGGGGNPYSFYNNTGDSINLPVVIYPENDINYIVRAENERCMFSASDNVFIEVMDIPDVQISADKLSGCIPVNIHFDATNSDNNIYYRWNFGDGTVKETSVGYTSKVFEESGVFDVTLMIKNENGCTYSKTIDDMINAYPIPEARFLPDPIKGNVITSPNITFLNHSTGNYYNLWDFGDGNTSGSVEPINTYNSPGDYIVTLIVKSNHGCLDTAKQKVTIEDEHTFYVPNAINANSMYDNSIFLPKHHGVSQDNYFMAIYDRWGEVIFKTNNIKEGWDGKIADKYVPVGSYTYFINYQSISGNLYEVAGSVTVLR